MSSQSIRSGGDIPATEQIIEERNRLRAFRGIAPELDEPLGSALDEAVGERIDALNAEIARRSAGE